MLDREAEITTRYGGGFVQSIDGLEGALDAGRSLDWFFFVNGIESSTGAAEVDRSRRRSDLVGLPRLDRGAAGPGGGRLLARAVRPGVGGLRGASR